jgi:hypothetical protein
MSKALHSQECLGSVFLLANYYQLSNQGGGEGGGGAIGGAGGGEEEEEGGQQVDFQCTLEAVNKVDAEHDHAALVVYC